MNLNYFKRILIYKFKKIFSIYYKIFYPSLLIFKRHSSYEDYIKKQKEKTLDPSRIDRWLGREWNLKLNGFRELFKRNIEIIKEAKKCICLGARTGQEVVALQELGKEAIGIDLVEFPPLTVEGDIHNLAYQESEFDFVFTNIFDHSLYPQKFVNEMERVCKTGGFILINLMLFNRGDDYSENMINNAQELINMFQRSEIFYSRSITNSFDGMNWEVAMRKI